MPYVHLAIAIVTEVAATAALRASDGMTRLWPSVIVVVGYLVCFYFLALCVRRIPIGVAYGIWSGVGLVLITIAGWFLYRQRVDAPALAGMGLIVAGVVVIQVFSKTQSVEPLEDAATPGSGTSMEVRGE
ncbi:MAG: multidrug efflux SMR transporter [Planctomycetota bacterium]|nr:multidrug efflux SMR transporter [Planctomycetota bacterium]MEE2896581.1 multidrug efflux SMR transporter [Planctomycetota bacterium]